MKNWLQVPPPRANDSELLGSLDELEANRVSPVSPKKNKLFYPAKYQPNTTTGRLESSCKPQNVVLHFICLKLCVVL